MSVQTMSPNDSTDIANQFTSKTSRAREKNWLCDRCGCVYLNRESFVHHMVMHTSPSDMPYKCEFCDLSFQLPCSLMNHRKVHKKNPLKCEKCGKVFTRKLNYLGHMLIHEGKEPFKCDLCGDEFPYKSLLKYHMRTHTGEHFACKICGKQLSYKCSLNSHMKWHCTNSNETEKHCQKSIETVGTPAMDSQLNGDRDQCGCSVCKTVPGKFKRVRMRPAPQHYSFLKLFSCTECNVKFYTVKSLQRHMEFKHKVNDVKEYYCKDKANEIKQHRHEKKLERQRRYYNKKREKKLFVCGYMKCRARFFNEEMLNTHKLKHTGSQKFSCGICLKEFKNRRDLKTHMVIHSGKYECDCGANFSRRVHLEEHKREHITQETHPYSCSHCDRSFKYELILKAHMKCHLSICKYCYLEFTSEEDLESHLTLCKEANKCIVCDETFETKSLLESHLMLHNEKEHLACPLDPTASSKGDEKSQPITNKAKKIHKCGMCQMSYLSPVPLAEHVKAKHDEDMFKCGHCDATFRRKIQLELHIMTHATRTEVSKVGRERKLPKFNPKKPFQCTICYVQYSYEAGLLYHQRLHNGIIQLTCQTCNAIFSNVEEYVNHQSIHGDFKPFQCGFCNISFCSEKFFTVHLRTCQAKKEYIDTKMQHMI